MKKSIYGLTALCALAFYSCDDAARLAKDIEGTWSGAPERFIDDTTGTSTIIESMTFAMDSTGKGGDMIIVGLVSSTGQISGSTSIMQPISVSAAAKAEILGKWIAVDDDEINVNLDTRTLSVNVDPSGVVLTTNLLDGNTSASTEAIKPQVAESIKLQITNALQMRYASIKRIDDIKIKGNVMEYEIGHDKFTASRQGPNQ